MTLDKMLNPKTIAVIGASRKKESVGHGIVENLLKGCVLKTKLCKPFKGTIYPINPHAKKILGLKCYKSILQIKAHIDLVIICVPARFVKSVMIECAQKKVSGTIIISAGFSEVGNTQLEKEIIHIAKQAGIRVIGPNCLGVIRTKNSLNASFAPTEPPMGNVAFISQSGALADSVIDWAIKYNYGFSTIITHGNSADLDVTDFLQWLEHDKDTKVITLYMEGVKHGKAFMRVAKRVSKTKPIVILKGGKTEAGTKAVSSHTGSLAGSFDVYKAAFKQSNCILVDSVTELFDTAKVLAACPMPKENSIAIITNGGGCGIICADYCSDFGIGLAELKKSTIKKLDDTKVMHSGYSRSNPLDIIGDATVKRYKAAVEVLLKERYIHGLIVIQTLQTMTDPVGNAQVLINAHKKYPKKPIICCYMGGQFSEKRIDLLENNGIPDFNDPIKAAKGFKALLDRKKMLNA